MPGFGSDSFLAICKQNSLGATAPSSFWSVPFANHTFDANPDELLDDSITGNPDEPDRVLGYSRTTGNVVMNLNPLVLGHFLRGVTGYNTVTPVGSGFMHKFVPRSGQWSPECSLPPYAFLVYQGDSGVNSAYQYKDAFINTFELSIESGKYVRGTFGVLGKDAEYAPASRGVDMAGGVATKPFQWSAVSLSINGTGVARFRNLRFSFDNKIAGVERLNASKSLAFFFRDGFRSMGRFSGEMDLNTADWAAMKAETEYPLFVNMIGVTTISSGVNEYFKLEIPRFKVTKYPTAVPGPGIVTVTVEGKAEYHAGSGCAAAFTLQNTFAAY